MKLQNLLHWGAALSAAGLLGASSPAAWAADESCPGVPEGMIFAYSCSMTANFGDGVAIQISGGTGTVSTTGLTQIDTAPLGNSTAAQAFQNGQFGTGGNSGQISTTETEPLSNPAGGSGTAMATASMGNKFTSSFTAVPFANGNPIVSLQRRKGNVVIPNLHASATGSVVAGKFGGIDASSEGLDSFSDVVSVTQAQINAVNKQTGGNLGNVFVKLSYFVSGSVAATNGFADADFFLSDTDAQGHLDNSVGGEASMESNVKPTDTLFGHTFTIQFEISPDSPVLLKANIDASGGASSTSTDAPGSYTANLSDTAQFLGVSFYADDAEMIPLPDIQLGSALGFDYIPADAILSPAGGAAPVPEASTWAMMLVGFAGLGALGLRRGAPRRARP